jgi:hypothetical protein
MPGLHVRPGGQTGSFGHENPSWNPQNVTQPQNGWPPPKLVHVSVTRGQPPPQLGADDVKVHTALVQPQVVASIAAHVSPAGHGPPQKPVPSGRPQTAMVDDVVLVDVVTVVLELLVLELLDVLVVGAPAGAHRIFGAVGATVRLPNWSTIGIGAGAAPFGQRSR